MDEHNAATAFRRVDLGSHCPYLARDCLIRELIIISRFSNWSDVAYCNRFIVCPD